MLGSPNFWKNFLLQKLGKWAKIRFFNLKKKLVINFHWICSIIKMFIFCVPAQILYLGKSFSRDLGQNALSQSDCMIFKWTISPEQLEQIWCQDSKSYSISGMNRWNELIFCILLQIHANWKVIENFRGWYGRKWVWLVMWLDSKIDCIWRMNRWNKLIFCLLIQIHKN